MERYKVRRCNIPVTGVSLPVESIDGIECCIESVFCSVGSFFGLSVHRKLVRNPLFYGILLFIQLSFLRWHEFSIAQPHKVYPSKSHKERYSHNPKSESIAVRHGKSDTHCKYDHDNVCKLRAQREESCLVAGVGHMLQKAYHYRSLISLKIRCYKSLYMEGGILLFQYHTWMIDLLLVAALSSRIGVQHLCEQVLLYSQDWRLTAYLNAARKMKTWSKFTFSFTY